MRFFRPTGVTGCIDGGEILHGGDHQRSPPPCQISPPPIGAMIRVWDPKTEIFTEI